MQCDGGKQRAGDQGEPTEDRANRRGEKHPSSTLVGVGEPEGCTRDDDDREPADPEVQPAHVRDPEPAVDDLLGDPRGDRHRGEESALRARPRQQRDRALQLAARTWEGARRRAPEPQDRRDGRGQHDDDHLDRHEPPGGRAVPECQPDRRGANAGEHPDEGDHRDVGPLRHDRAHEEAGADGRVDAQPEDEGPVAPLCQERHADAEEEREHRGQHRRAEEAADEGGDRDDDEGMQRERPGPVLGRRGRLRRAHRAKAVEEPVHVAGLVAPRLAVKARAGDRGGRWSTRLEVHRHSREQVVDLATVVALEWRSAEVGRPHDLVEH